jgi:hypothetical protein
VLGDDNFEQALKVRRLIEHPRVTTCRLWDGNAFCAPFPPLCPTTGPRHPACGVLRPLV